MPRYASTFISGLQKPIENLLRNNIEDVNIEQVLDGLILYTTKAEPATIEKLRFFNNTFLALLVLPDSSHSRDPLGRILSSAVEIPNLEQQLKPYLPDGRHGFRILVSEENKLVSGDKQLLSSLEMRISHVEGKELRPSSHNPKIEFWFLHRSEKVGFFLLRLTRNWDGKTIHAGELKPELSHVMCSLTEPKPDDIVLDPFSGYGSIPIEMARSFPCRMVFAGDRDASCRQHIRQRLVTKRLKRVVVPKQLDACSMKGFENGFISTIVTDPPWGFHEANTDINRLYNSMLNEFNRVLKPEGFLVVLTARKAEFEKSVAAAPGRFALLEKYDVLVSGRKAAIYKLRKAG